MQFNYTSLSGKRMSINFDDDITNNPENLKLKIQKFRKEYKAFRVDEPTFSEKASGLIKNRKWNSSILCSVTLFTV